MKLFFIIPILFISSHLFSQKTEENRPNIEHYFGVHYGSTTGQGFSYRLGVNRWRFQFTGIPIFRENNTTYISSGLTVNFVLREHDILDLFTYFGNQVIFEKMKSYGIWPNPPENEFFWSTKHQAALGVGIDLKIGENLNFLLQAGYGGRYFNKKTFVTIPAGEIGLYYRL